eukprot:gene43001-53361_t
MNDMRFNSPRLQYLPAKYVTKIENTSIFEMLDLFFRYYVEVFDVFGDVVSLKERGETLSKSAWPKSPVVLWRMSIEDPFDNVSSLQPADLGASLSRPGQLTTFKALRRAIYGLHSIVVLGVDTCQMNIKKFFSRSDLIHLARKSDYLGAVITPSTQWNRHTTSRNTAFEGTSSLHSTLNSTSSGESEVVLKVVNTVDSARSEADEVLMRSVSQESNNSQNSNATPPVPILQLNTQANAQQTLPAFK